jgi:hypothetical protein
VEGRGDPDRVRHARCAGAFSAPQPLATIRSTIPPGAAEDPATHELVLGIGVKER